MSYQDRVVQLIDEMCDKIQEICGEKSHIVFNSPVAVTVYGEMNQIEDPLWASQEYFATGIKDGYKLYGTTPLGDHFEQDTDLGVDALELAFILDKLEAKDYTVAVPA
jgi:hypothetical protein